MNLADLEDQEIVALAALLQTIVLADNTVTDEEREAVRKVGKRVGVERWKWAMGVVGAQVRTGQEAMILARSVLRPEAREVIKRVLLNTAMTDGLADEEVAVLECLETAWAAA